MLRDNSTSTARRSRFRLGLLLPVAAACLVACGGGGSSSNSLALVAAAGSSSTTPAVAKAKKTVLIYMNGSDLESRSGFATRNLQEMLGVSLGADVNVILEIGGTDKVGWNTLTRHQLKNGQLVELDPVPNNTASMADPATLTDFIQWGAQNFPAQQYVMMFWNHGGGPVGGFGADEITAFEGKGAMTLKNIKAALEAGVTHTGQKFELIGFDACLMASLEIASALSNAGKYLAASSDIEPGAGWDYAAILEYLARRPDASGEELGKKIANSYVEKNEKGAHDLTFSVTDLGKVAALQSAIDTVFSAFSSAIHRDGLSAWVSLASARANTLDFTTDIYRGVRSTDLMDLGEFLTADALAPLGLARDIQIARDALDEAVVYKRWGPVLESISGLTLYFPGITLRDADTQQNYRDRASLSPALAQFNRDYVNFVLDGRMPSPVVGQPTARVDGSLYSSLSNQLFENGYAILQDADGAVVATKNVDKETGGVVVKDPDQWPTLKNIPLLMAASFKPGETASEYSVPALRLKDCIPVSGVLPFNSQQSLSIGFLLVQQDPGSATAALRVAGYYGYTGASLHMANPRTEAVNPDDCFQLPQLVFDPNGKLYYQFTASRKVQFSAAADWVIENKTQPLAGHNIYTAVSDYSGQLLFSAVPASY